MATYKMKKEPVTGKARTLNINGLNLNISYQETLLNEDGSEIMKGEIKNLNLNNNAHPMPGRETEGGEEKKVAMMEKIEQMVADYLNS